MSDSIPLADLRLSRDLLNKAYYTSLADLLGLENIWNIIISTFEALEVMHEVLLWVGSLVNHNTKGWPKDPWTNSRCLVMLRFIRNSKHL